MITVKDLAKQCGLSVMDILSSAKDLGCTLVVDEPSEADNPKICNMDILRVLEANGKKESPIYAMFENKMQNAFLRSFSDPPYDQDLITEKGKSYPRGEEWNGIRPLNILDVFTRFSRGTPPIGNRADWQELYQIKPRPQPSPEERGETVREFQRKAKDQAAKSYARRIQELQNEIRLLEEKRDYAGACACAAISQELEGDLPWASEFETLASLWAGDKPVDAETLIVGRLLYSGPWLDLITTEMLESGFLDWFISDFEARCGFLFRCIRDGDLEVGNSVVTSILNIVNSLNAEDGIPPDKLNAVKQRMLAWPVSISKTRQMGKEVVNLSEAATIVKNLGKEHGQGMDSASHKQPKKTTTQIAILLFEFMLNTRDKAKEACGRKGPADSESIPRWIALIRDLPDPSINSQKWIWCGEQILKTFYPNGLDFIFPEAFDNSPEPKQQFERIKKGLEGVLGVRKRHSRM